MAGNALVRAMRLLFLLPFLAIMGYGLLMTKFTHEMQDGEVGFASQIVMKVGAAWLDHSANAKRDAVVDIGSLNDDRQVTLRRKVALTELPGGATEALTGARAELAALAAAKMLGEAECASMVQGFASACGFATADATISDDGTARLEVGLSFASPTPIGDTTNTGGNGLVPRWVKLTAPKGITVAPADLPATRARLYADAEAACAALRKEQGTCVISSIGFEEDATTPETVTLNAMAQIAYLGDRVTAQEVLDRTQREPSTEGMIAAAMKMAAEAQRAIATAESSNKSEGEASSDAVSMENPDLPPPVDARTLLDSANVPRLKNTQGGAKFVTAP